MHPNIDSHLPITCLQKYLSFDINITIMEFDPNIIVFYL